MPPPRPEDLPLRERHRFSRWTAALRAEQGARPEYQDAWTLQPKVIVAGQAYVVAALFDGLAGHPNGQEAAWQAADHLVESLSAVARPESTLRHLNGWVRRTGGFTTAVVALLPHEPQAHPVHVFSIGDSGAWESSDLKPALLLPKDGAGNEVRACLGLEDADSHHMLRAWPNGAALLLCTDGVDAVAPEEELLRALQARDVADGIDRLLSHVRDRGAPDNATAILIRRTA